MWKQLKVCQKSYFIYCNLNKAQHVTFILYDLKATWSQTLTLQNVKQNVKLLNKRFDFNEDNIREALMSDDIQTVALEEHLDQDSRLLKLKYRVKNCVLNYEWTLKKQNLIEFQQTFVQPLLLSLLGCHQQVEILTDSIRKKDIELKQFQIEGSVLRRKTLTTKPFDFEDFYKKYEDCNKTAINFIELAKYVKENDWKEEPEEHINVGKTEKSIKPLESSNDYQRASTKMSPRQRKRKVNELKMQQLSKLLNVRNRGLEYESSQSQTLSSGNSQTNGEEHQQSIIKKLKRETSSPRRSSRCAPLKQKDHYLSSEDKTDSDNEYNLRTIKQRKTTQCLLNLSKDSNTISNNEENKSNSKNYNAKEIKQKCVKSLNLSNNSRTRSSAECSKVLNYANDSEDEMKKLQETESGNNLQDKQRDDILANNNFMLSPNEDFGSRSNISNTLSSIAADRTVSLNSPTHTNLRHSSTPVVITEISSQLDNIKKELETLEAMRLADLKQRMCKV